MKYYTGVGSRNTPASILEVMTNIASELEKRGYILRSGGAKGADSAFEAGVQDPKNKHIYLAAHATLESCAIAEKYHPAWDKCNDYVKKLHGRNALQVLGSNLNDPSEFLICWTPDGCTQHIGRLYRTGGTGTAISIADKSGVRVINLARPDHYQKAVDWLNQ